MNPRTILFMGKPGSGKGTQVKLLSEKTGWPTMASGDAFRAIAKEESAVGHKVKKEMEEGFLMPDWFAQYVFQKSVFSLPEESSAIYDGLGRKLPEAEMMLKVLEWLGRKLEVVHIDVSDEHIIDRIEKRKDVEGRADDASVMKRLDEFRKYTAPCIEFFRSAGVPVTDINGEPDIESIHADILAKLGIQ
jgi:adenylate kinase